MLFLLDPNDPRKFPDPERAEQEPDGLLAVGGDLRPERLLHAYAKGIFPWYSDSQPILWWSPDPRTVLFPDRLHISRSLRKTIRNSNDLIVFDHAFEQVVNACAEPRITEKNEAETGTWITRDMCNAYLKLHRLGHAHSIEVMRENELVGGLYGVSLGGVFFGESMFSRISNASKVALVGLVQLASQWGFQLIDCQVYTNHLISLGAEEISRRRFNELLDLWCPQPGQDQPWRDMPSLAVNELL